MKKQWYRKIPEFFKWIFTICIVFGGWIIFQAADMGEALDTIKLLFIPSAGDLNFTWKYYLTTKIGILLFIAFIGSVMGSVKVDFARIKILESDGVTVVRYIGEMLLFILAVMFIVNSSYSPFIYFQF